MTLENNGGRAVVTMAGLFRVGASVVGAVMTLIVARLYQTLDNQQTTINMMREKDVQTTGELAVIQARINGLDSATLVRIEAVNGRLGSIENRIDRVQHTIETLILSQERATQSQQQRSTQPQYPPSIKVFP